ncbi:MAG: RagB/SusD family nutrient uptake outer membrane protein, partial [Bacteroidia bacterium]
MKRLNRTKLFAVAMVLALVSACDASFLDVKPNGALDESVLATEDGIETLLIGAYSMLDGLSAQGTGGWEAASSGWVFGAIRGMEANKGTDSGDQPDINPLQNYSEATTNPYLNLKWRSLYESISRCNSVMLVTQTAEDDGAITAEQATSFRRQARALRGHYHLEAWKMWQQIPYVDENTDQATLTNSADVSDLIIADLTEGANLPNNMGQIGRFNGTVAKVLLAKALMQMKGDYAGAKTQLADVIASGTKPDGSAIGLEDKFGDIFDAANRNG